MENNIRAYHDAGAAHAAAGARDSRGFIILDRQILTLNYTAGFLAVIILMYLLNARQNSSFKLMWIILILAVPVVGVTFYIYTRLQPGRGS